MSELGQALADFLKDDSTDIKMPGDTGRNTKALNDAVGDPSAQFITGRPDAKATLTQKDIEEQPLWRDIPNHNYLSDAYYNWLRARLPFTPEAEWNKDLVRGDRSTNVSGRDPKEIERLSRLADKLNNRVYLGPADIGHRTFTMGSDPIRFSERYQMPKIETEETRQMERMRQYEQLDRSRDITRQNDYKDLDRLWADRKHIELMRREGRISDKQADYMLKPLDEEIRRLVLKFDTTNRKHIESWEATLHQLGIPIAQGNLIYKTAGRNPLLAKVLAYALKQQGAPDMMHTLRNNSLYNLYNDPTLSELDKIFQTQNFDNWLSIKMTEEALKVTNAEAQNILQIYKQSGGTMESFLNVIQQLQPNTADVVNDYEE